MLREFTLNDFVLLESWITDADILFRFSGPDWQFPLSRELLENYMLNHPFRQFYIGLSDDGEPYAFGEIISNEQHAPRLGRLLIGNAEQRGKGLGQKFVKELLHECIKIHQPDEIYLFVFEDNDIGIQCYLKSGFTFREEAYFRLNYQGQEVKVLKMVFKTRNERE